MKARRPIEGTSYGPDTLKVLFQAFDQAWSGLAPRYHDRAGIEAARIRLANILLGLVREDSRDISALRDAALRLFDGATGDR